MVKKEINWGKCTRNAIFMYIGSNIFNIFINGLVILIFNELPKNNTPQSWFIGFSLITYLVSIIRYKDMD